ncbi:MAG: hypothetical protein MJ188_10630 [Treponema sp.]|nr:hypothetical protein [Treponema sp.]
MDSTSVGICKDFFQGIFSNLVAVNVGLFGALIAVAVFGFGIKYWLDTTKMKEIAEKAAKDAAEKAAKDAAEKTAKDTEEKLSDKLEMLIDDQILVQSETWYKAVFSLEKIQKNSKNKKDILVFILGEMASRMVGRRKFRYYVALLNTFNDCLKELVKVKTLKDDYSSLKNIIDELEDGYKKLNKNMEDSQAISMMDQLIENAKDIRNAL